MKQRLMSLFLAFVMLFTCLPLNAFAFEEQGYGVLTNDGTDTVQEVGISEVVELQGAADLLPKPDIETTYDEDTRVLTVTRYPSGANLMVTGYVGGQMKFTLTNDSGDGTFTLPTGDYDVVKIFALDSNYAPMCDAVEVELETCSVRFYDGERLIETFKVRQGEALGKLPSEEKASRDDAILLGYYLDRDGEEPFYAEDPVTEDMDVYALYEKLDFDGEPKATAFAQMDQEPDISFDIQRVSGKVSPKRAATLLIHDGSDPVELRLTDNGDDTYTVSAKEGFNEGCSYQLQLADGWVFVGKQESVRMASFSIAMDEVENLEMNDKIIYIADTDEITYTVGGNTYDVLDFETLTEEGGTFAYSGVAAGDLLCIYVGTHPEQRETAKEMMDPAVYVKVEAVSGSTVTYRPLGDDEKGELYNIPDNFPILVSQLPNGSGTVNISALDKEMYALMNAEDDLDTYVQENIAVGDFVTMYISQAHLEETQDVRYGRITNYNNGNITFELVTMDDILHSMDLYMNLTMTGEDILDDEETAELEAMLLMQVEESGFAEEAAYMLADIVTKTDGFREDVTLEEFLLTDANGNPIDEESIDLMGLGGKFKLTDEVELTVELIRSGEQLHFKDSGSVQLAVGVEAEFEVEVENDGKIAIKLSATFVEEVGIDPKVHANLIYDKVFFNLIPAIVGVKADAAVDVLNYTAVSFEAKIYTVEAKDEGVWAQLKNIAEKPADALGLENLKKTNPQLVKGLNKVGDVMDKIDTLKDKIKKAKESKEKLEGYQKDIADLYTLVSDEDARSWSGFCDTLKQTSITSDLLKMKDLTLKTELEAEYYDSLDALMERYSKMIEQESGWVELVDKRIMKFELNYCGLILGVEARFVVRADLSLAVGSNLEYQMGKRFTFWFKIEHFQTSSGSGSMDLVDEEFAFQFYTMGRLGLRAGVRGKIYVALGSSSFASIGIAVEMGPYLKLYGFFIYDYHKVREAGTAEWSVSSEMAGALHMEIGVYFLVEVEANAIGDLLEWTHTFLNKEIPLVKIGKTKSYYDVTYKPTEDDEVRIIDSKDTDKVVTMKLPAAMRNMKYIDLVKGKLDSDIPDGEDVIWRTTNRAFSYDPYTGVVTVKPAEGARYIEGELTITYRHNKMAFSKRDLSVTLPLVWHTLSDEELATTCTATVRAGSPEFGYETVWTNDQLHIGEQFDLPTAAYAMEVMGRTDDDVKYRYESYRYSYENATNSNGQKQVILEDTTYIIHFLPTKYSCTINGVQLSGGNTTRRTYYAIFGESFDFSDLEDTGTTNPADGKSFTRFDYIQNGEALEQPIDAEFAENYNSYTYYSAVYKPDVVKATFNFIGFDHEPVEKITQKGTMPDLSGMDKLVCTDNDLSIVRISPAVDEIYSDTQYDVYCKKLTGPKVTITFDGNGYDAADKTITRVAGSLFGLPVPFRPGYRFEGWYTAEGSRFIGNVTPNSDLTLIAEWTPIKYRVDFSNNANPIYVTYGEPYGPLPELNQTDAARVWKDPDGNIITEDSIVDFIDQQTLTMVSKTRKKIELEPKNVFSFTGTSVTYDGKPHGGSPYFKSSDSTVKQYAIAKGDFTIRYRLHGEEEFISGEPVNAGVYDVVITREADQYRADKDCYYAVEFVYESKITIKKADKISGSFKLERVDGGVDWVKVKLTDDSLANILAVAPDAEVIYRYKRPGTNLITESETGEFNDVYGGYGHAYYNSTNDYFTVEVLPNNPNLADSIILSGSGFGGIKSVDLKSWTGGCDLDWYYDNKDSGTFAITTADHLAALAYIVNAGIDTFNGKTILLDADLDLAGKQWPGIGDASASRYAFQGTFDGQGYTIRNMFVSSGGSNAGLFGYVYGSSSAVIKNLTVEDSYILGSKTGVGGIIAYARGNVLVQNCTLRDSKVIGTAILTSCAPAGGILGAVYNNADTNVVIDSCVNDSRIQQDHGRLYQNTETPGAGGMVGTQRGSGKITILNCVNYGEIISRTSMENGGIAGHVENGVLVNNVNFGTVNGNAFDHATRGVGGILGEALETSTTVQMYNNYNLGQVASVDTKLGTDWTPTQIGAIVSASDQITMKYNYYLEKSAVINGGESTSYYGAAGAADNDAAITAATFTSPTSQLGSSAGDMAGKTLIEALNAWVSSADNTYGAVQWAAGSNGYPVPTNIGAAALK